MSLINLGDNVALRIEQQGNPGNVYVELTEPGMATSTFLDRDEAVRAIYALAQATGVSVVVTDRGPWRPPVKART